MEKYVNVKITIWVKAVFEDAANMAKVAESIRNGSIESIYDEELGFKEAIPLFEFEHVMTPVENDGQPTIEVLDNGTAIWENASRNNTDPHDK